MPSPVTSAIANHVNLEEQAARTYRALSYWADSLGWDGSTKFFAKEAVEEMHHAEAFAQYALMRDESVFIGNQYGIGIGDMPKSLAEAYNKALVLEEYVMAKLQELSQRAAEANDWDAVRFLQPYLEIGTKSIYDLKTWRLQLGRLANDQAGLYAFDLERGE